MRYATESESANARTGRSMMPTTIVTIGLPWMKICAARFNFTQELDLASFSPRPQRSSDAAPTMRAWVGGRHVPLRESSSTILLMKVSESSGLRLEIKFRSTTTP